MGLNICLIGCGSIVNKYHGPSYIKYRETYGDLSLSGCCDINAEAAKQCAFKFGFEKYFTVIEDMLATCKPDAVCINVNPGAIAKIVNRVMELGYPVLMEKPPGYTYAEAQSIAETALKTGVSNQVAFNRRFMPIVREYKRYYAESLSPEPVQSIFCDFYRYERNDNDFFTTAIHGIDLVRFIAGSDYKDVRFSYQEMPQYGQNVCNIFIDGTLKNDAHVQLRFCPMAGNIIERVTVNLRGHTVFLRAPMTHSYDLPGNLSHVNGDGEVFYLSGANLPDGTDIFVYSGFYGEIESFFNDIKSGVRPLNDINTAMQSVQMMECIAKRDNTYTSHP